MILHNRLLVFAFVPFVLATAQNSTKNNQSKSKRTIADQVYTHGDNKAVVFYMENPQTSDVPELQASASAPGLKNFYPTPAKPLALVSVQQPIQVFEQDNPKQVAEQQVLYEFQQTPTNAVSNVHVKQLFQPNVDITTTASPLYQGQSYDSIPTTQHLGSFQQSPSIVTSNQPQSYFRPQTNGLLSASNHHPATSATIVSPVHHNLYTNHGLNSASFSYLNPHLPESQQYQHTQISPKQVPGKYIYLNGKIVYNPTHIIPAGRIPHNSIYHKGVYHNQQKLPLLNHAQKPYAPLNQPTLNGANSGPPRVNLGMKHQGRVPHHLPPITKNRFQSPTQLQTIDKPSVPVQQEESEEEEEHPDKEESDEEVEDEEDESISETKDEEKDAETDDDSEYERFPFEDDDYLEDDENHYFKPSSYGKNKNRGRSRHEEIERDHHDDRRDSGRGASKQYSRYQPHQSRKYRNPPSYESGQNYGYYEGYSSNSKFKSPKHGKKSGKKDESPSGQYKKVKYSKVNGGKPKVETIEGRYSENIPITHKQKVYKERWYVTKDIEGPTTKGRKKVNV